MKTAISTKTISSAETPLLAIMVSQGGAQPLKDSSLERAFATGDYKGKKDETLLVYGVAKAERLLLVGVGKTSEVTRSAIRRGAAIAASARAGSARRRSPSPSRKKHGRASAPQSWPRS